MLRWMCFASLASRWWIVGRLRDFASLASIRVRETPVSGPPHPGAGALASEPRANASGLESSIDKGQGNGWTWYRTLNATQGPKLVFGGYGVVTKGSHLLIIVTTPDDFAAHRAHAEVPQWR